MWHSSICYFPFQSLRSTSVRPLLFEGGDPSKCWPRPTGLNVTASLYRRRCFWLKSFSQAPPFPPYPRFASYCEYRISSQFIIFLSNLWVPFIWSSRGFVRMTEFCSNSQHDVWSSRLFHFTRKHRLKTLYCGHALIQSLDVRLGCQHNTHCADTI